MSAGQGHVRASPVLVPRLINWTLMGSNLLKRGEYARSLAFLALVHQHLLRAVRLAERNTANLSRAPVPCHNDLWPRNFLDAGGAFPL